MFGRVVKECRRAIDFIIVWPWEFWIHIAIGKVRLRGGYYFSLHPNLYRRQKQSLPKIPS